MMINCIAVDDEPLALDKIKSFVGRIPFLNLVSCCNSAMEAIATIKNNKVDLMFLDIQMDEFTGIQLLESLNTKPYVIFTTAYDEYAIKGFELEVTDYLLKPISFERFLKSVNRVHDIISKQTLVSSHSALPTEKIGKENFVFVKTENRMQKVVFEDILYIEGMKDYLRIITLTDKIMTLQSFAEIESVLPSPDFMRVHKSFIVAINKIESFGRNGIVIKDKCIPVGDVYKKQFMEMLSKRGLIKP